MSVYLTRHGAGKEDIRSAVSRRFGYNLNRTIAEIRPKYRTDLTCQGSVPEAIIAFLDSTGFEDAIRNAVSLGGDADTQAAIAGSIAEAHYNGVPEHILKPIWRKLPAGYRKVVIAFCKQYGTTKMVEQTERYSPRE